MPQKSTSAQSTSAILEMLMERYPTGNVSLRQMLDLFEEKAFYLLLLIFCIPLMLPFSPPGFTLVVALPIIYLSAQMVYGLKSPWLPEKLAKREMNAENLNGMIRRTIPWLKRAEKFFKPRLTFLSSRTAERLLAVVCLLAALCIPIPLPVFNTIASGAIFLIALGLMERDGLVIILGLGAAFGTFLLVFIAIFLGREAIFAVENWIKGRDA